MISILESETKMNQEPKNHIPELAIVGDLTENESELTGQLLDVEPGSPCTIYFDSPGGSPYCAMSLMTLIRLRGLKATGIVTGECSSAALWPFAACERRLVTPCSVLLFHPMRWQSEENVGLAEASEWARHFGQLEKDMDDLLADLMGIAQKTMREWINPGRYVCGPELVKAGIAEMLDIAQIKNLGGQPLFPAHQSSGNGSATREEKTSQQKVRM